MVSYLNIFFIGNSVAMKGDGSYIRNLLITDVCNVLNLSEADLRKRFCSACNDG